MVALPSLFTHPVQVQRGDIFALGRHRLMCGDSTNAQDVARLFGDEHFGLCFTSPPYSDQRTYTQGPFDWHSLMCGAFDQIIAHGKPDCHILINLGLSHKHRQVDMYWLDWLMHCREQEWPLFGWYVWDKLAGMPRVNDGRLMVSHEFIFHFCQDGLANKWIKTIGDSTPRKNGRFRLADGALIKECSSEKFGQPYKVPDSVIRVNRANTTGKLEANHPAVFPVALPEFMMHTWSQSGDIVYEPFCGSGTSIIAGESLQRRVYALEISGEYCQLAIERWQEMTGQQAERIYHMLIADASSLPSRPDYVFSQGGYPIGSPEPERSLLGCSPERP